MKNALIIGATGLVGKNLVKETLASNLYKNVIVFTRRNLNIENPKLKEYIVDFDNLQAFKIDEKIDECFCALGTTIKKSGKEGQIKVDYTYVLNSALWCEANNVNKFLVVSSKGADYNSKIFYTRLKGQLEEAVKKINIPSVYIVRPSLILGDREEFRLGELIGQYAFKLINPLMNGKLKKYKAVSGNQIARCMIHLAQDEKQEKITIESDFITDF
jgi:uncharacterized protein YbjT (DUF2867 family)